MQTCRIGLVSISDRAARGVYVDQGLPALQAWLNRALTSPFTLETRLVPDEQPLIEKTLRELVDESGCHLVLTTGGAPGRRGAMSPLTQRLRWPIMKCRASVNKCGKSVCTLFPRPYCRARPP